MQNKIGYGLVKNRAGNFVKADTSSVSLAAAGAATDMPADFRASITNATGRDAYPISTFTWLLIPAKFQDSSKASLVRGFLQWMLQDGQKDCVALAYAPLPAAVVAKEEKQIALIQ